ncbi:hypothetical protein [Actinoplanes sp. HUAS TT8]|uniref:hypothetical protein n=1 Tax=Actinoplanes sp. HUAS TT8 TaxID=3447453 RepID=UPI003F522833
MRTGFRQWLRYTIAAVLLTTGLVAASSTPANAAAMPGGRHIYTVALGHTANDGTAWVRLAMYYFNTDSTVSESYWFWSSSQLVGATGTGITTQCSTHNCEVRTAPGFQPGVAAKVLTGTYAITDDQTTITWSGGTTETWKVTEPSTTIARIDLVSTSYGATGGYGYGSNASNNAFVNVGSIPKQAYPGTYTGWTRHPTDAVGTVDSGTSTIAFNQFQACTTNCATMLSAPTTACKSCSNGNASPIRYYLAGSGRRNFYEHWCVCLTSATCYTGGSHRKPTLQVLDDNGAFHGWVGVETSNSAADEGYFGYFQYTQL